MLLDKPIKKHDTITMKLSSGEEILAEFIDESNDDLIVSKPATISATPDGKMGIIPWMMTSKAEKVRINRKTVIAFVATEEEIAKAYMQTTTSLTLA